jgi:hypothetical protein
VIGRNKHSSLFARSLIKEENIFIFSSPDESGVNVNQLLFVTDAPGLLKAFSRHF